MIYLLRVTISLLNNSTCCTLLEFFHKQIALLGKVVLKSLDKLLTLSYTFGGLSNNKLKCGFSVDLPYSIVKKHLKAFHNVVN